MRLIEAKEFENLYRTNGLKKNIVQRRLKVLAVCHAISFDQEPYFSVTGELWEQSKNGRWLFISCGAIHDEIAEVMPFLKPVIKMHLASQNGVPMHAFENAAYWAEKSDLFMLASLLRVSQAQAETMLDYIAINGRTFHQDDRPDLMWKEVCDHFGLPEQWKKEAEIALDLLKPAQIIEEAV